MIKLNLMAFFKKITTKTNPNQDNNDRPTASNKRVYFGVSKKEIPKRTPFQKSKKKIENNNFVPKQQYLNTSFYKELLLSVKSGKFFRDLKYWILIKANFLRDIFFRRQTQITLISIFITSIIFYSLYITAFSTEFLVKEYRIKFSSGSYIDRNTTEKVIQAFNRKSILGYIPENHLWFLNNQSLTNTAKEVDPSITQVLITGRYWPATADLTISTQPILVTLNINSKYYVIGQNGHIIGTDYGGQRQKVIIVKTTHKNVDPDQLTRVFSEHRPNSLVGNNQLNRLYFIDKVLPKLQERDLKIIRTEVKTIFEKDTDVFFVSDNETKFLFDSLSLTIDENLSRLDTLIQTTNIGKDFRENKIDYLDFRTRDRVHICYYNQECADRNLY